MALAPTLATRSRSSVTPGLAIAAPAKEVESRKAPALSLDHVRREGARYVAELEGGAHAELTLEPHLQQIAERLLDRHHGPYGAAVLLSVDDGRVLAMAGRSSAEPNKSAADLCLTPWAPAASVFKIVTAAALVDAGVNPNDKVCYHDGIHSVEASNLTPHPRLDRSCNSLAFGLAKSQNAILARLAHDHLNPTSLDREAHALGFGASIPFDAAITPSEIDVPSEELPFARVASGFWQTTLSPMHGAYLAATIAREGTTPPLRIVDRVVRGDESVALGAQPSRRAIAPETARAVGEMMVGTTRFGTAKLGFHDRKGRPVLSGISVAGKTGTLNRKDPFLGYSWFVGYAPANHPKVAVAVLLGNSAGRDMRAHRVASELLQGYFAKNVPVVASR